MEITNDTLQPSRGYSDIKYVRKLLLGVMSQLDSSILENYAKMFNVPFEYTDAIKRYGEFLPSKSSSVVSSEVSFNSITHYKMHAKSIFSASPKNEQDAVEDYVHDTDKFITGVTSNGKSAGKDIESLKSIINKSPLPSSVYVWRGVAVYNKNNPYKDLKVGDVFRLESKDIVSGLVSPFLSVSVEKKSALQFANGVFNSRGRDMGYLFSFMLPKGIHAFYAGFYPSTVHEYILNVDELPLCEVAYIRKTYHDKYIPIKYKYETKKEPFGIPVTEISLRLVNE